MLVRALTFALAFTALATVASKAIAQDDAFEKAAAKLLETTVTIRILSEAPAVPKEPAAPSSEAPPLEDLSTGVTVCSGTSLGRGLIVTFVPLPDIAAGAFADKYTYRVTLPDGEQATARPRVVDAYSGLMLLEIENREMAALKLAEKLPVIGGSVLTAAASGIEKPLVSMGVLSGVDRTIRGTNLPPMFQCDVSTTDASCGAAVIDKEGKLIGIIGATEAPGERFGWTYAIPYRHIRRVLEAQVPDRLVTLTRQRPTLGLKLGPGAGEGTVIVERVVPGGPADIAGIKQGDRVHEAEGFKIRSAYQAVALILKRQPGEKIKFLVGNEGARREVEVMLGGAASLVTDPTIASNQRVHVGPQLNVRAAGPNQLEVRGRQGVDQLSFDGAGKPTRDKGNDDEVERLKTELEDYRKAVAKLQQEGHRQQAANKETERTLETMREELAELRRKLEQSETADR